MLVRADGNIAGGGLSGISHGYDGTAVGNRPYGSVSVNDRNSGIAAFPLEFRAVGAGGV